MFVLSEIGNSIDTEKRCEFCFALPGEEHHPLCPNGNNEYTENWRALPPGTQLQNGAYQIGFCFPPGGCGITYIGWEFGIDRIVAIKECYPSQHVYREPGTWNVIPLENHLNIYQETLDRLKHEAHIQHILSGNAYIANVHAIFPANNTLYFVMDYVEGRSLREIISSGGPMDREQVLTRVALPLTDALSGLHSEGILHLDIAPDNIYITHDGKLKLLDFGAAQTLDEANHVQKLKMLKRGYAPIEQYRKQDSDVLGFYTDIYAAGATIYYALTGSILPDALLRSKDSSIDISAELAGRVPDNFLKVLLKALEIAPEDRFQNVGEFKAALLSCAPAEEPADPADDETTFVIEEKAAEELPAPPEAEAVQKAERKFSKKWLYPVLGLAAVVLVLLGVRRLVLNISGYIAQREVYARQTETAAENGGQEAEPEPVLYSPASPIPMWGADGELLCYLLESSVYSLEPDCMPIEGKTCVTIQSDTEERSLIVGKTGYIDDNNIIQ